LEPGQQPLRFRHGQTQIGDIAQIVGTIDLHDVQSLPLGLGGDLHQPQNPDHAFPQVKDRPENARVAGRSQNSRQFHISGHSHLNALIFLTVIGTSLAVHNENATGLRSGLPPSTLQVFGLITWIE
jgi:hypothetical protein